jgi:hypothetical protein
LPSSNHKFMHVYIYWVRTCEESRIQGLFKDIQGHVSANSRTEY